jgi:hypothetical protein
MSTTMGPRALADTYASSCTDDDFDGELAALAETLPPALQDAGRPTLRVEPGRELTRGQSLREIDADDQAELFFRLALPTRVQKELRGARPIPGCAA